MGVLGRESRELELLGAAASRVWARSSNRPCVARVAALERDRLILTFDGLLTANERALAATPAGRLAVDRRLAALLEGVYSELAHLVEGQIGLPIAQCSLRCDPADGLVRCEVRLQPAEQPRLV